MFMRMRKYTFSRWLMQALLRCAYTLTEVNRRQSCALQLEKQLSDSVHAYINYIQTNLIACMVQLY